MGEPGKMWKVNYKYCYENKDETKTIRFIWCGLFSVKNRLRSLWYPERPKELFVWANFSPAPQRIPEVKHRTDFQLGVQGTGDQELMLMMTHCNQVWEFCNHSGRCKIARVEKKIANLYFSFFIHFVFSPSFIEKNPTKVCASFVDTLAKLNVVFGKY